MVVTDYEVYCGEGVEGLWNRPYWSQYSHIRDCAVESSELGKFLQIPSKNSTHILQDIGVPNLNDIERYPVSYPQKKDRN